VLGSSADTAQGLADVGAPVILWNVRPFVALPHLTASFDAIAVTDVARERAWSSAEWDFFFEDVRRYAGASTRIVVDNADFGSAELCEVLSAHGVAQAPLLL
jgi:hypothetical protein